MPHTVLLETTGSISLSKESRLWLKHSGPCQTFLAVMATGDTDIFSRIRLSPQTLPAMYSSDILGGVELAPATEAAPTSGGVFMCLLMNSADWVCVCVLMCMHACRSMFWCVCNHQEMISHLGISRCASLFQVLKKNKIKTQTRSRTMYVIHYGNFLNNSVVFAWFILSHMHVWWNIYFINVRMRSNARTLSSSL